jgi:erythromycin esterase-like protein
MRDDHAVGWLRATLQPLTGERTDCDSIISRCGSSSYVLIGEASHGTDEFYRIRADLTKQLIEQCGFHAVAVEADWPDAHRVNRYVRHRSGDSAASQALGDFNRFPRWMWRNGVVADFVEWLRRHNRTRRIDSPEVGFYGLDLYSLNASRAEVVRYLRKVDPAAARIAEQRYACFDHFGGDEQSYGWAAGSMVSASCENEVVQQLSDLQRRSFEYMHRDGLIAEDDFFSAEQNARLVRNAEEYYRAMFRGRKSTWNLRDSHMAETLNALSQHLRGRYGDAKVVVWEHNSHVGDSRATEMSRRGEHNVGQLLREQHGASTYIIGFTTWTGTVTAASNWGGAAEEKKVRPGLAGSWETLFHDCGSTQFVLDLTQLRQSEALNKERLERAIGVIYRPESERVSHYFGARLLDQFDAVLHIDTTRALDPMDRASTLAEGEVPETFPTGV